MIQRSAAGLCGCCLMRCDWQWRLSGYMSKQTPQLPPDSLKQQEELRQEHKYRNLSCEFTKTLVDNVSFTSDPVTQGAGLLFCACFTHLRHFTVLLLRLTDWPCDTLLSGSVVCLQNIPEDSSHTSITLLASRAVLTLLWPPLVCFFSQLMLDYTPTPSVCVWVVSPPLFTIYWEFSTCFAGAVS